MWLMLIDAIKDKEAWKKTFTDPGVLGILIVLLTILLAELTGARLTP
jgi:hypothetical protein